MKKKKAGQPTKYKEEYCQEIIKFFDIEPHFETPVVFTDKKGNIREEVKFIPCDLPLLCAFAVKIGVCRDTLHEWGKRHKKFSDSLKKAKECQRKILITNGLKGLYNTAFAIFTAKNVIGWRDKTEISGDTDKPLGVVILPSLNEEEKKHESPANS